MRRDLLWPMTSLSRHDAVAQSIFVRIGTEQHRVPQASRHKNVDDVVERTCTRHIDAETGGARRQLLKKKKAAVKARAAEKAQASEEDGGLRRGPDTPISSDSLARSLAQLFVPPPVPPPAAGVRSHA